MAGSRGPSGRRPGPPPRAPSASLGIPSRPSLSDSSRGFPSSPPRAVTRTELRLRVSNPKDWKLCSKEKRPMGPGRQ